MALITKQSPLFFQERPGKGEKVFRIMKFKTMTDARDIDGNLLPDKERVTKLGNFMRKFSLDEIPQLINVIKGDMSLIGPRPLRVHYLPYYTEKEKLRHTVRPGITGLAQVSGRNAISWDEKLEKMWNMLKMSHEKTLSRPLGFSRFIPMRQSQVFHMISCHKSSHSLATLITFSKGLTKMVLLPNHLKMKNLKRNAAAEGADKFSIR